MFPCTRGKHTQEEDNTVYFSSLIAFTLKGTEKYASSKNKRTIDSVVQQITKNYKFYRNTKDSITYNFWNTAPEQHFPHSILGKKKKFQLPDDADCTSIIYLSDDKINEITVLKQKLQQHANSKEHPIKNIFARYKKYAAYTTWFGKKMPQEFDLCVQTNILYFVFENKLQFTHNDSATLQLLHDLIVSGDYLKYAFYLSPSYKSKPIVLYHLARLIGTFNPPALVDCKEILLKDIYSLTPFYRNYMDEQLLGNALLRLSSMAFDFKISLPNYADINNYSFFCADLFSPYARPSLRFISASRLFAIPFRCKAYNLTLLLEYELLKNNQKL